MSATSKTDERAGRVASRLGPLLTLTGAGAAALGVFLPWAHVTVVRNPVVGSAVTLDPHGWSADGPAVVVLGLIAAVLGALLLWRDAGTEGRVLRSLVLVCGLLVVGVTFWDSTHVKDRFTNVRSTVAQEKQITRVAPRVHARLSPWIIVSSGGGALLVFAAVIDRFIEDEVIVVEVDDEDGDTGGDHPARAV